MYLGEAQTCRNVDITREQYGGDREEYDSMKGKKKKKNQKKCDFVRGFRGELDLRWLTRDHGV